MPSSVVTITLGVLALIIVVGSVVHRHMRPTKCPRFCPEIGVLVSTGVSVKSPTGLTRELIMKCRYHGEYRIAERYNEDKKEWGFDSRLV